MYSPLLTCADCQLAYRKWLCSVSFTRCAEPIQPQQPTPSQRSAQQPILPAYSAVPPLQSPRNMNFPTLPTAYTAVLPCLETCTAVDRACPNLLQFRCPAAKFNANESYGVGFIDSGIVGVQGKGKTGASTDRWGNVWCNGN